MSAKFEKQGKNNGEITFEIETDKIKEGLEKAFLKVKKDLTVPGFRKGKVSRQVFNRMYGEESLYEDALNILLPEAYEKALEEVKVSPVDQPDINIDSLEKDSTWVLKAKVTLQPEVELGDYKGLTVPKQSRRVTKKDVEDNLEAKRQQQAELVLKEDEAAVSGDTVIIDFEGKVDGVAFDGGKSENYTLELGSNSFIPGFEDQLVGHKAGEDVDVTVTFPEDYQAEDLRGKEAIFAVKVHEVKGKELPEMDDEFAKDVDEEVNTLEELQAKTKDQIKETKDAAAKEAIQDAAIELAVDNAKVDEIPNSMIEEDVHRQMDQYLANMQQQGIDTKMYFQLTGTSEDDLHKQFEEGAERRVKTNLVLEAIVAAEKIEPSEEEVSSEISNLAEQYGMEEDAVRSALSDDMVKHDIAIKKVVDELADSAVEEAKMKK
ncbi:trigger factor [Dellaglioa algida]|uniref:Trigger factor n=1 Tax=Dellaglioa algida DSM 15638 TaxID=1423719 RepID=A0A0R1HSX2_9LACO|nr:MULTISPECIES: trigger factor [Dellaglioa]KRK46346.1 trigger factor [Dellaglioa algida DSM 15638]MCZ2492446.1 trigger factor [Dellaglioa carnosa]MDK1727698.1 trigger factor [Dellaglioa algida]MDK1732358.1 trigger factor [Dellaglioa algida]MDK1733884.1 trigger factor [Dellaglioa algida]